MNTPGSRGLWRWLALALAAALMFAACSGDDDDDVPVTAEPEPEAPAEPEPETPEPEALAEPESEAPEPEEPEPEAPEPEPVEPTTIRLVTWGAAKFIDFIDLYVAEENGYFAEAGIILEQLPGSGAGDAVFQLLAGNAEIAMADPFSGYFAVLAGEDLEGIYCPYTQNWLTMLVNTAAGIDSPADLRGKTIAVTSQASTSKWYAALLLAANGITEDDVTFAATGIDFGSALLSGEAQAASTWGSINWALIDNGGIPADQVGDYVIWEYEQVPGPNDVYFAKRGWVNDNADALGRFIDALERAKLWIEANPDEAAVIGSNYAVGADNLVRNRAVIDYRIEMQNNGPGVADNGMGWCDVPTMQDVADQGRDLGILEDSVDVASIISNRYIDN